MKIKLVLAAAPSDALRDKEPFMPLSLPLLAAAAPGHEYDLVDMLHGDDPLAGPPADLVGISVRLTAEGTAYDLADAFRQRGVPVVLGGPQVSAVPYRAKAHADAVAVGEGEPLWPRIVEDVEERGALRDFYVCSPTPFDSKGGTLYQLDRFPDLSDIRPPRRDLLPRRYQFDTVFASRGCPVGCDFCAVPSLFGSKTRLRPVPDVVAEIESFGGFFYLIDDTVFGRPATYDYYLELYEAIGRLGRRRYWHGQANLDALASDQGRLVVRRAVEAGLLYAAVGVESLDPSLMKQTGTFRKAGARSPVEAIYRTKDHLRYLQDLGVFVSCWFTVGYEQESERSFYEAFELCEELGVLPIISPLNAIPGTRLHQRLEAEGSLRPAAPVTNVARRGLTDEQILRATHRCVEEAFAPAASAKRILRFARSLDGRNGNSLVDRLKKTFFIAGLHKDMRDILRRENENLASPIPQNYVE